VDIGGTLAKLVVLGEPLDSAQPASLLYSLFLSHHSA
jgi:hypothetical protein